MGSSCLHDKIQTLSTRPFPTCILPNVSGFPSVFMPHILQPNRLIIVLQTYLIASQICKTCYFFYMESPYCQSLLMNSFIFLRPTQVFIYSRKSSYLSLLFLYVDGLQAATALYTNLSLGTSQSKSLRLFLPEDHQCGESFLSPHNAWSYTKQVCQCQSFKEELNNTSERQDINSSHLYSSYHLEYSLCCFFCICLNFHIFRFKRILSSTYLQTINKN